MHLGGQVPAENGGTRFYGFRESQSGTLGFCRGPKAEMLRISTTPEK